MPTKKEKESNGSFRALIGTTSSADAMRVANRLKAFKSKSYVDFIVKSK